MKEKFIENGIEYIRNGDYYIPNWEMPKKAYYGKYGMMHEDYIKEHRTGFYNLMLLRGTLWEYLSEIDNTCCEQVEHIISQIAEKEGICESLKSANPMEWVRRMNLAKSQAEEFVLGEYVYRI